MNLEKKLKITENVPNYVIRVGDLSPIGQLKYMDRNFNDFIDGKKEFISRVVLFAFFNTAIYAGIPYLYLSYQQY